ncbi:hypothetical protein HF329_29275 [Chitinophaga oryzae]|uniref:Uncharacterized protein n=1 Tax=Chitinophaga oryzae TaxID=2725414 RepID=A0AAE7D9S5_9BACT|nr:hypothetical protein [Chitinophaga oryzae]QJB35176.1 hypothetical protein HF329_29275 [Chitinophaga oryzae]
MNRENRSQNNFRLKPLYEAAFFIGSFSPASKKVTITAEIPMLFWHEKCAPLGMAVVLKFLEGSRAHH